MNSKGMAAKPMILGLVALFSLTVIYLFFDPVIDDNLHTDFSKVVKTPTAQTTLDKYLDSWQIWVAPFLLAIFIYTLTGGAEQRRDSI